MKLLLDENLPHQLRLELPGHDVFTTAFMGWKGIENGELLILAAADEFDALITNDRGLEYQQSLDALPLSVIVILAPSNKIEAIRPLITALLGALGSLQPKSFMKVEAP